MVGSLERIHLVFACGFAILTMNLVSTAPSLQHYGRYNDTPAGRYFTIDQHTHTFIKDGKPFQYISGSFHYFRIPSSYWLDRLQKAKAAGLDGIDMYVAWNVHSPEEGVYQFDGERNLEHFLELIHQVGLLAIVRAGPYICAEWSFVSVQIVATLF
ncbi:beta-galactosidase [Paragonimus westermani]|uniref:Beta-galactosidase n=1 Tax=Paragonimus westermani TaxID=34504 RepID=A0A5J4NKW5_9TREM|nr:beta-galactosidase [Paragonimus westermani]